MEPMNVAFDTMEVGTTANLLDTARPVLFMEDHKANDVLEGAVSALKSKYDAPFLRSGKMMDMPLNMFNSEDTVVKLSKSNNSFHLYKYVLNKKNVPVTKKNQLEWNRLVNELRLKIKRSSEKNVIATMELKVVNTHREMESPPLPPLTSVKQIDDYLFQHWGDKMRLLYMKITHDMYNSRNNKWMRDGLRDLLNKWCITLYQPVLDENGNESTIVYTDEQGSWLTQMKLGRKTSQKRRERYLKNHIKEQLYCQPQKNQAQAQLIPVNKTGYGSAKAFYKVVQSPVVETKLPHQSTLHSLVEQIIKQGYSKEQVLQEFDRISLQHTAPQATTHRNQHYVQVQAQQPNTTANINITMTQTAQPINNSNEMNNNSIANATTGYNGTSNATSGNRGKANATTGDRGTANAIAGLHGMANANAGNNGTANATTDANVTVNNNNRTVTVTMIDGDKPTTHERGTNDHGSETTITDDDDEVMTYPFDDLDIDITDDQFQQPHGSCQKNFDNMRDEYDRKHKRGRYKPNKKKKKPQSPPTKPTRSSPRGNNTAQPTTTHHGKEKKDHAPKKLSFQRRDPMPSSGSSRKTIKVTQSVLNFPHDENKLTTCNSRVTRWNALQLLIQETIMRYLRYQIIQMVPQQQQMPTHNKRRVEKQRPTKRRSQRRVPPNEKQKMIHQHLKRKQRREQRQQQHKRGLHKTRLHRQHKARHARLQ